MKNDGLKHLIFFTLLGIICGAVASIFITLSAN